MSPDDYWESAYTSGEFKHWESQDPSPELVALIAARVIKKGDRILDVGCGGGLDSILLAKCGFQVVGIDGSAAAIKIARRRATKSRVRVDWRHASAFNLPLDDSSIDFVNDRGVFHILDEFERSKYAAELMRVLKSGGRILIRGSSRSRDEHFNPVTEKAIDKHFPPPQFRRGPVILLPLYSVVGVMEGRMVVLTKSTIRMRPTRDD